MRLRPFRDPTLKYWAQLPPHLVWLIYEDAPDPPGYTQKSIDHRKSRGCR